MNLIDDLDFFPFPQSLFEHNVVEKTKKQIERERKNQLKDYRTMSRALLQFVVKLKQDKVQFPKAVLLLHQLREQREILKKDTENMEEKVQQ